MASMLTTIRGGRLGINHAGQVVAPIGVVLPKTAGVGLQVDVSANNISAATSPFLHFCDQHMQSTGIGTKHNAPGFYV